MECILATAVFGNGGQEFFLLSISVIDKLGFFLSTIERQSGLRCDEGVFVSTNASSTFD